MKTLYFEKAGCDFWNDEPIKTISDIGNYRVRTAFMANDGRKIYAEFSRGYRYETESKTGKAYKQPKRIHHAALNVNFAFEPTLMESGGKLWRTENNIKYPFVEVMNNYEYTKKDILKFLKTYCRADFDEIEVLPITADFHPLHSDGSYSTSEDYNR
ncbi:MAG: hypothetical protein EOM59_19480 [Clostridia bacterium]|nr:hypothetical protein [Clostridia bacterium]